jgi:hypothetical protein
MCGICVVVCDVEGSVELSTGCEDDGLVKRTKKLNGC